MLSARSTSNHVSMRDEKTHNGSDITERDSQQVPRVSVNGAKPPYQHRAAPMASRTTSSQQQQKATSAQSPASSSSSRTAAEGESSAWGANFWVTLVEPQVSVVTYTVCFRVLTLNPVQNWLSGFLNTRRVKHLFMHALRLVK